MRGIEKQMIEAIKAGKNYLNGNTRVRHDPVVGGCEVEVYLNGNLIAKRFFRGEDKPGEWQITLAGWNTPLYRSRLTALCQAFNPGCLGVSTKRGYARIIYIREDNGKRVTQAIFNTEWVTV